MCAALGSLGEWFCPVPDMESAHRSLFKARQGEHQSKHVPARQTREGCFTHLSLRLESNRTVGASVRMEAAHIVTLAA